MNAQRESPLRLRVWDTSAIEDLVDPGIVTVEAPLLLVAYGLVVQKRCEYRTLLPGLMLAFVL